MRQVMPHRNNIGADRRRCKCFLCHVDNRLPESGALLHSCRGQVMGWKRKYHLYINNIKRYSLEC